MGILLGKNTGADCQALLEGIFPTQGSNPGLLHYRQILYHLSHQGSPKYEQKMGLGDGYMCGTNTGKVGEVGKEKGESSVGLTCTFEKKGLGNLKRFKFHLYAKHHSGLGR